MHVSNRYLRLAPVVRRLAENCGMQVSRIDDEKYNASHLQSGSLWVLVTQNDRFLRGESLQSVRLGRRQSSGAALDRPVQQSFPDSYRSVVRNAMRMAGSCAENCPANGGHPSVASVLLKKVNYDSVVVFWECGDSSPLS